jgi:predicted nucleic acid-binding protein
MNFFDTNVLVYLFDAGARDKARVARDLIQQHGPIGEAVISTQVLQEFYVAVTRKLSPPLSPDVAVEALRELGALPVVQVDTDMVIAAARRSSNLRLSYWDSLIVESALRAGADTLFSEDLQDGRVIESLKIVNPFAR